MSLKHRLEYFLILILSFIARALPLKTALGLGELLGDFTFSILRLRRKVTLENLKNAFKAEKDEREIGKIARMTYRHFGRMLIEFARFPLLTPTKLRQLVTFSNIECVEEARRSGKGILFLSGHFGNWELMAAAIATLGRPFSVLFAPQKNVAVDRIIKKYRQLMNVQPILIGVSAKGILRALRRDEWVGILIDQDAGRDGEFVNFFGRWASAPKGPAAIALKWEVPIIMAFTIRDKNGRHRIIFEKFPDVHQFPPGKAGVHQITRKYTETLERYVRKYPDHWFWLHRRWKSTKPTSEPCANAQGSEGEGP